MPTHMLNHTRTVYRDSNPGTVTEERDSLHWDKGCITDFCGCVAVSISDLSASSACDLRVTFKLSTIFLRPWFPARDSVLNPSDGAVRGNSGTGQ